MAKSDDKKLVASNKKAFHNYEIVEKLEAGIVLEGYEVKSIRNGHVTFQDSYARVSNKGDGVVLMGCNIRPYNMAQNIVIDADRDRKLLLNKAEIRKLTNKTKTKELVIVPISMYFSGNRVKVELGLGKPKKKYDKRASLKEKDVKREIDRGMKSR